REGGVPSPQRHSTSGPAPSSANATGTPVSAGPPSGGSERSDRTHPPRSASSAITWAARRRSTAAALSDLEGDAEGEVPPGEVQPAGVEVVHVGEVPLGEQVAVVHARVGVEVARQARLEDVQQQR